MTAAIRRCRLALLLFCAGCATAPSSPPTRHFLQPYPIAQEGIRLEGLENGWIRLRGGDFLLDMQGERVAQSIALRMVLVNLSGAAVPVGADTVTLKDAQGIASRPMTPDEVIATPPDAPIVNEENNYEEGSVHKSEARMVRADTERLRRTLDKNVWPKGGVPAGRQMSGILYFSCPRRWPAHLSVRVGDKTFEASFTQPEYPSL